ncbi:MAG: hypothetical protein BM485_05830 [Desulfobulbaceae bacterium DB1]|nr:MAG: hypothetical protein BM485_05830 [Desulfobulbaceae bacterium DB1]
METKKRVAVEDVFGKDAELVTVQQQSGINKDGAIGADFINGADAPVEIVPHQIGLLRNILLQTCQRIMPGKKDQPGGKGQPQQEQPQGQGPWPP